MAKKETEQSFNFLKKNLLAVSSFSQTGYVVLGRRKDKVNSATETTRDHQFGRWMIDWLVHMARMDRSALEI